MRASSTRAIAASKLVLLGGFEFLNITGDDGMGNSASVNGEFLRVGAGYGVTDKISGRSRVHPPIAGDLSKERVGKGPIAIFGEFELVHNDKLNIAASADFTYGPVRRRRCRWLRRHRRRSTRASARVTSSAPKVGDHHGRAVRPGPGWPAPASISLEEQGPESTSTCPSGVALQATPQIYAYRVAAPDVPHLEQAGRR